MFSIFVQCTRAQYEALYMRYRLKYRVALMDVDRDYEGGHCIRILGSLGVFYALIREGYKLNLRYFKRPIEPNADGFIAA